jgi:hypothetical protein
MVVLFIGCVQSVRIGLDPGNFTFTITLTRGSLMSTKSKMLVDLILHGVEGGFSSLILVCSRCGRYVPNYDADFYFNGKTYSLCQTCFPFAFSCFINGDILNLISFEDWDKNLQKQKQIDSRLLDDKINEIT